MKRSALSLIILATILATGVASTDDRPGPRLKLIFVERFRFETWDNAVNLNDAVDDGFAYTRNRTSLGLDWQPIKNIEFLGKITNEFRVYLAPKVLAFNWHEVFVDNLCVRWTIPGRLPFAITAGRQDINFGERFVIADSTPLDGSRSFYFNALRVDADLSKGHRLTFFAHAQETSDRFLPVINEGPQALTEQSHKALVLYYAGTFGKAKLDAYAIRKITEENEAWPVPTRIDTFGARAQIPVLKPLVLVAEGAVQTGTYGAAGLSAFGGLIHLDHDLTGTVPFLKAATIGGIFLSGDKPRTENMEGWDPIFSRITKWSESYVRTLSRESRLSYWSNLTSLYGSLVLDLSSRAAATLTYQVLGADEAQITEFPGGTGLRRGTLFEGRLDYMISRFLAGRVVWEHFTPGSFYFEGASSYNWLQFEMIFRY